MNHMMQLFELFTKKTVVKIMEFFMKNPSGEFYEAEIRGKIKIAKGSSLKWLKKLVEHNFLSRRTKGRLTLYRLNSENVLIKELKKLMLMSLLLPDLKEVGGVEVYLYGSGARGEDREESDVDLLIIGKRSKNIVDVIKKLEKKINRRVKVSFFTQLEWSRMSRKDPAFYERVEKDKIKLM